MRTSIKAVSGFIARSSLMLVLLVTAWLLQTPAVQAAGPTCTVGASGAAYTTIQAAVNDSGCATINVAAGTYTENVTIGRNVTINGATTDSTIVDGNSKGSVFQITNTRATLSNLIIQHGSGTPGYPSTTYGGGIYNSGAILIVNNSTFRENTVRGYGGGIMNYNSSGTVTVNNSTFSGNQAGVGGAIGALGPVTVNNSTFSGNSATKGGAIEVENSSLVVNNSTLSGNSATRGNLGGGLYLWSSPLTLVNTIVANSLAGGDCVSSAPASGHHNLIEDSGLACGFTNGVNSNMVGRDPNLGTLQNNGGPTPTIALLAGSPVIDAGDDSVCSAAPISGVDQRGVKRAQGAHCDIGAYEVTATNAPVVTVSFTPNGRNGYFTTNPAVGRVTALGEASITAIACENADVSNQSGLGTVSASATVTVNGAGGAQVKCRATDSAGHSGAAAGSQNVVYVSIDVSAPKTTIASQPTNPTGSNTATFTFSGVDSGNSGLASFQCQVDNSGFAACSSPQNYSALSLGTHTFQVRAVDNAGNVEANPATYTWAINPPLPTVTLNFTPNGQNGWFTTNPAVGRVTVTSQVNITNIRCNNASVSNLAGIGTANASATVAVTAEGSLTIVTCTATDSAGQTGAADGSPNRADIWLDSLAPDTTITAQPANPASSPAASVSFTGADTASAVAGYQCQLDGGSFAPCTSPTLYNGLSNGSHTFQVRAIDKAGNVDASPASVTWTVSVPTATPTNTPVPPTATPTMTPTPTATNTPVPPTATPTATATNTAVPPTATPTATATNTALPPTATPTATATNTPVPPTATPTATATNTPAVPVANNDVYATNEDTPLTIAAPGVLSNDSDTDSPVLTAVLVNNPANGSLTLNPDGSFVYTPNANFNGSDSFTYAANDGLNNSNVATVSLTINAVNDAPVATNDSYTVTQETPLLIPAPGLLSNDSDVEGNALTVSLVSNPANGSVTLNANGGFSYLPNNGFVGTDSFTYQTSDGQSNSNAATVQITVNPGTGSQPPFGITYSASVDLIGAPCSVMSNVLEDNSLIRLFPERLRYALPSAVTVTAPNGGTQVIPAGTLVDSYYLHADWVNQGQNTAKVFDGNVTFAQPILGIIKRGDALLSTNAMLGNPGTTYATGTDQGIEDYDDSVSFSNAGKTLTLHLTVWNTSDALRVITPARQDIMLGGAVEGIGSPCSVVEGKLESDSAMRFFAERLNYVLPAALTVDGYGANGVGARGMVLPQGARVNVYYVHADLVGDGQGKQLRGTVTFDAPILAVLVDGASLNNTHNTLGATWHPIVKTAYSARGDQGLEAGDQISVQQNRVDFAFSGNADVDQIRIITAAGGSATVSAATDSAADDSGALPADAVKVFPVAGDTNDAVTPSDNNGVVTTDQLTNQLYLPLISR